MDADQMRLVRLSLIEIMERKAEVGTVFYERLFAVAPDTRAMFKGDIKEQFAKLIEMLSLTVGALRDPQSLHQMLEGLARRHVGYGVHIAHYDQVGDVLIWTLEHTLAGRLTPQVREAWVTLYETVASIMKRAVAEPTARSA